MPQPMIQQRMDQIEGYAKTLVQQLRIVDERRHILEPLIWDDGIRKALHEKLDNTAGVHAYNHLVPMMAQDLVREIARLFLDEGNKTASLINLFRKAREPEIKESLRQKFRDIPDNWHSQTGPILGLTQEQTDQIREEWRDKDKEDFEKSFEEGWEFVEKAVDAIRSNEVANKIKSFRDRFHAHLEMAPLGQEAEPIALNELDLTYIEIVQFLDEFMPAIFELGRILTGNVYDVEGFSDAHKERGLDMWTTLSGRNSTSE